MMIVVNCPLPDNTPEVIHHKLAVMMVVMDHVRVRITIDLIDAVFVIMGEDSGVCGQNQRGRTE